MRTAPENGENLGGRSRQGRKKDAARAAQLPALPHSGVTIDLATGANATSNFLKRERQQGSRKDRQTSRKDAARAAQLPALPHSGVTIDLATGANATSIFLKRSRREA
jgi:hypothetical protein